MVKPLGNLCKANAADPRHYWIIMGLMYPGILGALIYELAPHLLYTSPLKWQLCQWLVLALMVHFALDFAYSADDKSKQEYSWCKFPFDMAIVWLLYAALKAAGEGVTDPAGVARVCEWMTLTRICAIAWEWLGSRHPDKLAKWIAIMSDAIPLLGYVLVRFFTLNENLLPTSVLPALILVVVIDSVLYWFHEPIYRLFKGGQR